MQGISGCGDHTHQVLDHRYSSLWSTTIVYSAQLASKNQCSNKPCKFKMHTNNYAYMCTCARMMTASQMVCDCSKKITLTILNKLRNSENWEFVQTNR